MKNFKSLLCVLPLLVLSTVAAGAPDTKALAYNPLHNNFAYRYWDQNRVYLQIHDDNGHSVGDPIEVAENVAAATGSITCDTSNGHFLVTWYGDNEIAGQRYSGTGQTVGDRISIWQSSDAFLYPHAVYDPDLERFLVLWYRNTTSDVILEGRFITAQGALEGDAPFAVESIGTNPFDELSFAYSSAGSTYLLAYVADGVLYAQLLAASDGSKLGQRSALSSSALATDISYDSVSENFLVTWADATIHAVLVSSDGVVGSSRALTTGTSFENCAVSAYPTVGRFLVVGSADSIQAAAFYVSAWTGDIDGETFAVQPQAAQSEWTTLATNTVHSNFAVGFTSGAQTKIYTVPGISTSKGLLTTSEGGAVEQVEVWLGSKPEADVVANVTTESAECTVAPATLHFTSDDWDVPQIVAVTGVDDDAYDGKMEYQIVFTTVNASSAASYNNVVRYLDGANLDDEYAIIAKPDGFSVVEGYQDTLEVTLSREPEGAVIVSVESDNAAQVTVAPTSLAFSPRDWDVPQLVTIDGVNDAVDDGNIPVMVLLNVLNTHSHPGFHDLVKVVSGTAYDDDAANMTIDKEHVSTSEGGGNDQFSIAIASEPTGSVVVDISSSDMTEATVEPARVVFLAENWATPQVVHVLGVDDSEDDGDQGYTILIEVNDNSGDTHYAPFSDSLAGSNQDDDETVVCSDGLVGAGEHCDDGNLTSGDGCTACAIEPGWNCAGEPSTCSTACGDGIARGAESCDDNNTASGDGCDSSCKVELGFHCSGEPSNCRTVCGDGLVRGNELCDDGGTTSGDGCDQPCRIETGWRCQGEPSMCSAFCGDGLIRGGEQCDDGGAVAGDGCDDNCLVESLWRCTGEPSSCNKNQPTTSDDDDDDDDDEGCGCRAAAGGAGILPLALFALLLRRRQSPRTN